MITNPWCNRAARAVATATLLASAPAAAEWPDIAVELESNVRYDDNVYRFSDRQRDRFEAMAPGNVTNGRFRDMESDDDWVWRPELALELEVPGIGEKNEIEIAPWVAYDLYAKNEELRYFETGLDLRHELRGPQHVDLGFSYASERLRRNHFVDSVPNPGPNVSLAERIYTAARYEEWEIGGAYERQLWSTGRKANRIRLIGELGLGYEWRIYNGQHANRDREGVSPSIAFETRGKRWSAGVGYTFSDLNSPGDFENVIQTVGLNNVVASVQVDRSRHDHAVEIGGSWRPLRRTRIEASYEWRRSDYSSSNPLDTDYFGREDDRHRVETELGYRIWKGLWVEAGMRWTRDDVNLPSTLLVSDEESDYEQWIGTLGFTWRFSS